MRQTIEEPQIVVYLRNIHAQRKRPLSDEPIGYSPPVHGLTRVLVRCASTFLELCFMNGRKENGARSPVYAVQSVRHGLRITQAAHTGGVLVNVWRTSIQAAHRTHKRRTMYRLAAACGVGLCAVYLCNWYALRRLVCAAVGVSLRPVRTPFISVFSAYNSGVRTLKIIIRAAHVRRLRIF